MTRIHRLSFYLEWVCRILTHAWDIQLHLLMRWKNSWIKNTLILLLLYPFGSCFPVRGWSFRVPILLKNLLLKLIGAECHVGRRVVWLLIVFWGIESLGWWHGTEVWLPWRWEISVYFWLSHWGTLMLTLGLQYQINKLFQPFHVKPSKWLYCFQEDSLQTAYLPKHRICLLDLICMKPVL
jgi:hypothetical protein